MMNLTECEERLLRFYVNNHNAKWMQVFNNKHPFIETTVVFYNIFKKKLKSQPITCERTYIGMFKQLVEGKWYFIPNLLKKDKEECNWQK